MNLAVDLHSHSGYAGGVGQIKLEDVALTMKKKGIDVFGTGDCLLPARSKELKDILYDEKNGLFTLEGFPKAKFLLQTEIILSTKLEGYRNKTVAHHIILFPNFKAVEKMQNLMNKWKMKNTIGRPFVVTNSQADLVKKLFEIQAIDPFLEVIPAHVMTPDGIMGSKNNLKTIREFYGNFTDNIRIIETGLSADPKMLEKIPDFHKLTMISNSDCHSAALNRIGREFTIIDTEEISYKGILEALRANRVLKTAEFYPTEGRYFNTGHRANRKGHSKEIIFDENPPKDLICPICNKKMNLGVKQRCDFLQNPDLKPLKRNHQHLIPLIEVVADSIGIKSVKSKKVKKLYAEILEKFDSEIKLWNSDDDYIKELLDKSMNKKTINHILKVKNEKFKFNPPGFDGNYGVLVIE